MKVEKTMLKNLVFIRLNPGDDLLQALTLAMKKNNINNAIILMGVGSVTSHHFHVVASTDIPPKEYNTKGEAAADIVNINGAVINGRVHAHIIFSNEAVAYGGHLEKGCEVLTFSIITLAEVDEDFDKWDSVGNIEDLLD
ncbi:MAG: PPC domain-containing DNA-binding protein [Eubacteriaceae bacterium]